MSDDITVVMESDEHGREVFPRSSWEAAFETIRNLVKSAEELDDGTERLIGVLVNPTEDTRRFLLHEDDSDESVEPDSECRA